MTTQRAVESQDPQPEANERVFGATEATAMAFVPVSAPGDDLADAASELDDLIGDDTPSKAFREDPEIDRRIIEGMLQDRDQFITAMADEGYTEAVVLRRAAELGLSEALIRQVKGVAADLAGERPGRRPAPASLGARTCLSCDRIFLSSGPGNRLCMRCRGGDAGLAQL